MKKLFLLSLMAMLLPFAAWAEDFTVKVSSPSTNYAGTNTVQPTLTVTTSDGTSVEAENYDVTYELNGASVEKIQDAGTYTITVTGKNDYEDYTGTATYTVKKVNLTVFVGNVTKTYGTSDDELTPVFSANGFQAGDDESILEGKLHVARIYGYEDLEDVGQYQITLKYDEIDNYNLVVTSTGALNIVAKSLNVTFENTTWAYGETEEKEGDVTATVKAEDYAYNDNSEVGQLSWRLKGDATLHNADTYAIEAYFGNAQYAKNYTLVGEGNIEISSVALTVTVEDLEKTYGMNDPAFEASATGWKYNDEETVKFKLTRETGENVGEYTISGCEFAEANTNYTIVYTEETQAKLTIKAKSLADADIKIEVAEADQVYQGQAADFSLSTITVTYGNKEIDQNKTLTAQTDYTFTITENVKNAGEKVTVTVTAVEGGNYADDNATYSFEIAQADLKLTPGNVEINFDATTTTLESIIATLKEQCEVTAETLKPGDTLEDLEIEFSLDENEPISIGTHNINIEATSELANNYNIDATATGTLTIKVSGNDLTRIVIGRDSETSALLEAYNGYVNTENTGFWVHVKENRILKADQWYTMVLPFDITVPEFSSAAGYAVVDVPNTTNDKEGVVSFKLRVNTEVISANTLFIFKVAEDRNLNSKPLKFKLQGTKSDADAPLIGGGSTVINYDPTYYVEDKAGNEYHGIYEYQEFTEEGYWYMSAGTFRNAGDYYSEYGSSVKLQALQGYVYTPAGAAARILIEEPDGSTTVINGVNADAATNAEGWYTIGGVKLNAEPTQKGIYINNGKKVVIK